MKDLMSQGKARTLVKAFDFVLRYNTIFIFLILLGAFSLISDVFFTQRNIFNLLRQVSPIGVMSMGMLLVILTAGIDLSVGSMMALGSVLVAKLLLGLPGPFYVLFPLAIIITILAGLALGSVSGFFVANRRMAPFVVTLAMMTIAKGLAYYISSGRPIALSESGQVLKSFGSGYFLGIPQPVILMLVVFLVVFFILRYTVFGRIVVAIGSNETAVRLSGVRAGIYKFLVYSISGGLATLAGIISTSRTGVGSPIVGQSYELDVIAAVVIGGASLSGGRGTAVNTLLGVFILGMIENIMNLMDVPPYPQWIIKGLIIIFAVLLQGIQRRTEN
ncbi:MAG: ABC transporter permease [Planctomycetota bacterium]